MCFDIINLLHELLDISVMSLNMRAQMHYDCLNTGGCDAVVKTVTG